jgi:hypothetical protein
MRSKSLKTRIARKEKQMREYERVARECGPDEAFTREFFLKRARDCRRQKEQLESELREGQK